MRAPPAAIEAAKAEAPVVDLTATVELLIVVPAVLTFNLYHTVVELGYYTHAVETARFTEEVATPEQSVVLY